MKRNGFHFGLVGWPLEHSRSPAIHQAALQDLSLQGDYQLFPVEPLPQGRARLEQLLDRMRGGRLQGLNVTIPWKQDIQSFVDTVSPTAKVVGAINTLASEQGKIAGDNTDAPGFLADAQRCFPHLFSARTRREEKAPLALVLGAGGSARAVVYALLGEGWRVVVAARRLEQAQTIKRDLSALTLSVMETVPLSVDSIASLVRARCIDFIVNATPLGMAPNVDPSPWPQGVPFPDGAALYDLVYNPPETNLVRTARRFGLAAITGGGMLVEQAALSFERWTGLPAPRHSMAQAFRKEFEPR